MSVMPVSDIDLFSDDVLRDPWLAYAELRAMGPAIWMSHSGFVAVPRYEDVRQLLRDDKTFISGLGVGLYDKTKAWARSVLIEAPDVPGRRTRQVFGQLLAWMPDVPNGPALLFNTFSRPELALSSTKPWALRIAWTSAFAFTM